MKSRETHGWIQEQIKAAPGTILSTHRRTPQNREKQSQAPRTATTAINTGQSIWSFISVNFLHTEAYKIAGTFQSPVTRLLKQPLCISRLRILGRQQLRAKSQMRITLRIFLKLIGIRISMPSLTH